MSGSEQQTVEEGDIEETVESGFEYREYSEEKRQKRREDEIEERAEKIKEEEQREDINLGPELNEISARVTKVTFEPQRERHIIEFEDCNGDTHTDVVDASVPEDSTNRYVRLCEWFDVDPEYPAELRGEIIPIEETDTGSVQIDYPPIQKRLSPVPYKLKRGYKNAALRVESSVTLQLVRLLVIIATPPAVFIPSFFKFMEILGSAETATGIVENLFTWGSLTLLIVLIVSGITGVLIFVGLISLMLEGGKKGLISTYKFLFPEE